MVERHQPLTDPQWQIVALGFVPAATRWAVECIVEVV
ncbi:hypothetical protein HNP98_001509 [Hymenobacter sp. 9A]|uniref:Transposase n=1 Tax=Hymenobacter caeli TaxID=2735894 RepID=A0ABX2FNE3_9BACT|nr:hypothetical protein [Hymenobacter caeli]